MTLIENINEKLIVAIKAKDKDRLTTLRQLKAVLQNEEILLKRELTKEEEITVVSREVKQTKEELEGFQKATGDYSETISRIEKRLDELQKFLPTQLTNQEVEEIVKETIASVGANGKGDMGKVMGAVMPKLKGKTDGKVINQTVARLLS